MIAHKVIGLILILLGAGPFIVGYIRMTIEGNK